MVWGGGVEYEKETEQEEGGRKYGAMNKKNCFGESLGKGGVTHKKLRESSGKTEREGQGQRLQNRNDRSRWRGREGQQRGERVKSSQ